MRTLLLAILTLASATVVLASPAQAVGFGCSAANPGANTVLYCGVNTEWPAAYGTNFAVTFSRCVVYGHYMPVTGWFQTVRCV